MIVGLVFICVLLIVQNCWLQVRHARERKAWDADRARYVSTALVAVDTQRGNAAASVVKERPDRPEPVIERPRQIDL